MGCWIAMSHSTCAISYTLVSDIVIFSFFPAHTYLLSFHRFQLQTIKVLFEIPISEPIVIDMSMNIKDPWHVYLTDEFGDV